MITLPVAVPANVGRVLYVQMRMIASIAYIGGFDPREDQVQTLAYACLTGSSVADVLKPTGIRIGEKIAEAGIKRIPVDCQVKLTHWGCGRFSGPIMRSIRAVSGTG